MRLSRYRAGIAIALVAAIPLVAHGQLTELAFYHLGEDDGNVSPNDVVEETVDAIEERNMGSFGEVRYSADTPNGIGSTLSVAFDGDLDNFLFTDATPWHTFYPGFRVGMEAWIKADPEMEGADTVPMANGNAYYASVDFDGYPLAHAGGNATPPGDDTIEYGEWQHIAFWTTGSFWQVYLNGVPQHPSDALPSFNYGGPSGFATLGADADGTREFIGLIDEHRVFTWTGAFNPGDLLYFTRRKDGDVNEDGLVNQEDYDIWRMNVGADLTDVALIDGRALGDVNVDSQIDLNDFGIIKANKTPGELLIVPEPASAALLLIGLAVSAGRLRHQRVRRFRNRCDTHS